MFYSFRSTLFSFSFVIIFIHMYVYSSMHWLYSFIVLHVFIAFVFFYSACSLCSSFSLHPCGTHEIACYTHTLLIQLLYFLAWTSRWAKQTCIDCFPSSTQSIPSCHSFCPSVTCLKLFNEGHDAIMYATYAWCRYNEICYSKCIINLYMSIFITNYLYKVYNYLYICNEAPDYGFVYFRMWGQCLWGN